MDSIKARRVQDRSYSLQSKVNEAEQKILTILADVLPEYCNVVQYLPNSGPEPQRGVYAESCRCQKLEEQLAAMWSDSPSKQKLLFAGSQIKFHRDDWKDCRSVIQRPTTAKSEGPILYGEELILKNTAGDDKTQKVTFLPFNKSAGEAVKEGPVMSDMRLQLSYANKRVCFEGVLEINCVSCGAIRDWIEPLVPKALQNLERNVAFLGFVVSAETWHLLKSFGGAVTQKPVMTAAQSIEEQLLLAAFTSDKDLDQSENFDISDMEKLLATGNVDCVAAKMQSINGMLPHEARDAFSQWPAKLSEFRFDETSSTVVFSIGKWKDICSSIYKDGEATFQANALAVIRKDLLPRLQRKLESQKAEAEKLREPHYKMEEEDFLFETKKTMSQSTGMR